MQMHYVRNIICLWKMTKPNAGFAIAWMVFCNINAHKQNKAYLILYENIYGMAVGEGWATE